MAATQLICLIVVVTAVSYVSGEACYNCLFTKDCEDMFDVTKNAQNTVTCDMKTSACAKIKAGTSVSRFCLPGCKAVSDYSYGGKKGSLTCCTGNKCNGSATIHTTAGLMLIAALLAAYNLF